MIDVHSFGSSLHYIGKGKEGNRIFHLAFSPWIKKRIEIRDNINFSVWIDYNPLNRRFE